MAANPNQSQDPEDQTPLVAAGAQWFGMVASTLTRIEEAQGKQTDRMDKLIDTTNHRLDDFRDDMTVRRDEEDEFMRTMAASNIGFKSEVALALERKASKEELVQSIIRTSRPVQLAIVGVFLALAPVVADHWHMLIERISFGF